MDTKVKEVKEEVATVETKKVMRRGLGNARGTDRLKFSHELANPKTGLFTAHLDSVLVSMVKIGDDTTGMPSFNGLEIPKIVFTFASNEPEVNRRHYIPLTLMAVESNVNTIPGGKEEWKINIVLNWLKHILDVFVLKGRDLTEEEESALQLPFIDFDENGDYVPVEPEVVIDGWKTLFENFENILVRGNEEGAYYKTKDDKNIPIWIKIIRYYKSRNGWQPVTNGDLTFPNYVGQGCIELFKPNVLPSIKVDTVKECILPMNIEKKKAKEPNMGGMSNAMPNIGGGIPIDPMSAGMGGMNDVMNIAADAGSDMPF